MKADDVDVGDLTTFAKIKDNKQTLINGIILKIKDLGKDNVNISFVPIDKNIPSKTIITSWINNTAKPNIIIDIIKKFDGTYKDKNNNVYNIIKAKKVI